MSGRDTGDDGRVRRARFRSTVRTTRGLRPARHESDTDLARIRDSRSAIGSPAMAVLATQPDRASDEFGRRREHMEALVAELRERTELVAHGGGERALERHRSRGKLTARERVDGLLDPGAAFLELNALAAWDVYDGQAPAAGIVTGIGRVEGRERDRRERRDREGLPATVKKHLRAQEVALQNRLRASTRGLGWCVPAAAGGGLPRPRSLRPNLFNQARLSALGIPQIAVVMGSCTAGGAYVPAMSDETVIVRGTGTIFIGGPPLVKAATGHEVSAEERAAPTSTRAARARLIDRALGRARARPRAPDRPESRRPPPRPAWEPAPPEPPAADPGDLHGLIPEDFRHQVDARELHRAHRRRQPLPRVQGAVR